MRLLSLLLLVSGCTCGHHVEQPDAGPGEGEGEGQAGEGEGEGNLLDGGVPPCDAGPPATCGQCGTVKCNLFGAVVCDDPGFNDCAQCGQLDQSVAHLGAACGVELCGTGRCNVTGTAIECLNGDVLRNVCGGCAVLSPAGALPGDACSACGTGTEECTIDEDSFVCFRGRSSDNQCGGCGRCVLFHAFMADHNPGGTLGPGTTAIIEDIGGIDPIKLVFDPMVEGPGACCLPDSSVFLSATENPFVGNSFPLSPPFSASGLVPLGSPLTLADPVRIYDVPSFINPSDYRFVVVADTSGLFLDPVFSVGDMIPGAPADAGN